MNPSEAQDAARTQSAGDTRIVLYSKTKSLYHSVTYSLYHCSLHSALCNL